jgi:exodeoxyribonuclease VII small subunit
MSMSSERRRRDSANRLPAEAAARQDARASTTPDQPLAFEEALGRLDEAVTALESGNLPLEDALDLYEEGMRMAQRCQELLDTAELRVRRLQVVEEEGSATSYVLDDFDLDADD